MNARPKSRANTSAAVAAVAVLALVVDAQICASSLRAQPAANEGYCVGINPENCPYTWTQENGRWRYNPTIAETGSTFETPSDATGDDRNLDIAHYRTRRVRHREHVRLGR